MPSASMAFAASACFPRCTAIGWTIERVYEGVRGGGGHRAAVFVHCGVLTVGVRAKLGLPSVVRPRARRSAGGRGARGRVSVGAGDHSALRRRVLPRGADGGGPVPEHPSRHVQLEQLDEVPSRSDARRCLPAGACRRRPRAAAVRYRLVVLPSRLAGGSLRRAVCGARKRSASAEADRALIFGGELRPVVSRSHAQTLQRTTALSRALISIVAFAFAMYRPRVFGPHFSRRRSAACRQTRRSRPDQRQGRDRRGRRAGGAGGRRSRRPHRRRRQQRRDQEATSGRRPR